MRLTIALCVLLTAGCDKLWSGSVVSCGPAGFPCPPGYTPPGADLALPISDGGTGDMTGNPPADMTAAQPTYTSVFVLGDTNRTTLVGSSTGEVRTYTNDGQRAPAFMSKVVQAAGKPIVGVWQGDLSWYSYPSYNATIIVPEDKQIFYKLGNGTMQSQTTTQTLHGLWVGAWNSGLVSVSTMDQNMTYAVYAVGDAGLLVTGAIGRLQSATWKETLLGTAPRPTLRAVGGLNRITSYDIDGCLGVDMGMGPGAPSCPNGLSWVVGDSSSIWQFEGMWRQIASTQLPAGRSFLGVTADPYSAYAWTAGSAGAYATRDNVGPNTWTGNGVSGLSMPFAGRQIRAMCAFNTGDVWAVGDLGTIYRYAYDLGSATNAWMAVNVGKDLSKVDLMAVHCLPNNNGPARVTIVGTNRTLLAGEADGGGNYSTWQAAADVP